MWINKMVNLKKNRIIHRVLLGISLSFLIVILGIAILASQLLAKNDFIIISTTPIDGIFTQYSHFRSTGGSWTLSDADINTLAQLSIKKGTKIGPAAIETVFFTLKDKSMIVNVYAKVFGISCIAHITINIVYTEKYILVTPQSVYVGKLNLPLKWALDFMKKYSNQYPLENGSFNIPNSELPSEILSLLLDNSKLTVVWKKPNTVDTITPTTPKSPTTPTTPTTSQTTKDLLISTNNQLKTVAANVKTESERVIVNEMRVVITKVIANQNYDYKPEADAIKAEYSNLTTDERSDLKTMILVYMNKNNLLKLQKMFSL